MCYVEIKYFLPEIQFNKEKEYCGSYEPSVMNASLTLSAWPFYCMSCYEFCREAIFVSKKREGERERVQYIPTNRLILNAYSKRIPAYT